MEKSYITVRASSAREVLEAFLKAEFGTERDASGRSELDGWLAMSDEDFLARLKTFASRREGTNPLLTWTVGTLSNQHHLHVRRWVLATAPIHLFFTCGLNPSMSDELREVGWNLFQFSKLAEKFSEFRLDSVPQGEMATVFGVAHLLPGKNGTIELVDGAHRFVSLAHQGLQTISSFVAELH